MTEPTFPLPATIETLLAERTWVRGVARSLVRDEAAADDLTQDAWIAVLERPEEEVRSPRAWLGTVLRRGASKSRRGDVRRDRREQVAARPESVRSTVDVLADAEWHRKVVDAVLALEEPYRATVLLRYFEDLPPREVAARMGVPVATVRTRAQRAIERLRARFDAAHGGDRRAWAGAIASLAGGTSRATVSSGGAGGWAAMREVTVMGVKGKALITVAALVLLLGGGAWLTSRLSSDGRHTDGGNDPSRVADAGGPEARPTLAGRGTPPARSAPDDQPAGGMAGPNARPPTAVELAAGELAVVQAGAEGKVVPVPRVQGAGPHGTFAAFGQADGRVALPAVGSPVTVWVSADGYAARRLVGLANEGTTKVELQQGVPAKVRFRAGGAELDAAEAQRRYASSTTPLDVRLVADANLSSGDLSGALERMLGGADGTWQFASAVEFHGTEARLRDAVEPGSWWLVVPRPGLPPALVRATARPDSPLEFEVDLGTAPRTVHLRFVDAETKAPLPGAIARPIIEFGDDSAFFNGQERIADARGELDIPREGQMGPGLREPTWWVFAGERVRMIDGWSFKRVSEGSTLDVEIRKAATITGTAWGRDGKPAEGARVVTTRKGYAVADTVRADGRFTLRGIALGASPEGKADVVLVRDAAKMDTEFAEALIRAGETTEITLGSPRAAGSTGSVRGKVTAAGRPLAGVMVAVGAPRGAPSVPSAKPRGNEDRPMLTTTDADGRFKFEAVPAGDRAVFVLLGDPRIMDDAKIESVGAHAIEAGVEWVVDFDLPDGALRLKVVDALGNPVSGAWAAAQPMERRADTERFPGFSFAAGWSAAADLEGVVVLRGLVPGVAHKVYASQPGRGTSHAEVSDLVPGSIAAPAEATIRLPK